MIPSVFLSIQLKWLKFSSKLAQLLIRCGDMFRMKHSCFVHDACNLSIKIRARVRTVACTNIGDEKKKKTTPGAQRKERVGELTSSATPLGDDNSAAGHRQPYGFPRTETKGSACVSTSDEDNDAIRKDNDADAVSGIHELTHGRCHYQLTLPLASQAYRRMRRQR